VNGYPYWLDTLENAASSLPAPTLPERADVAIVGAGYTGLAAARHLARSGARVVVLEAERIGRGASSRSGGQVLTGLRLDPASLVHRYGEPRAREMFAAASQANAHLATLVEADSIDCDYRRSGHVAAAWKPAHFNAFRV
jgi:glycine/D-amino acid oxidase-like deaminating enzyme